MGVPALFRWLSKKYPKIILPVVEEEEAKVPDDEGNEIAIPVDISRPNPNEVEFDNLYLDMNGIVHPATHPEAKPAPETEEDMMVEIFKYTERVVNMIRPRKMLFMAVDGVAPRAKMNQQRSRRFRSAQEAEEKEEARKEAVAMWEAMGKTLSEEETNKKPWDSNAITPGTPFMDLLAASLRYWVVQKMNTDPGWKQMQVIISDANVPGEGEHKIMDFIRRQRSNPGHDPNTRHVIYGLDADLIMLALATHEPYFRILREDVFAQSGSATACRICGQEGHYAAQCTGTKADIQKKPVEKKPYIFLDVATLREYLEAELRVSSAPFSFNLEQAIDDWVFLIFFVGNDFLPHLPSLEIREGAIDTLLKIWRDELPRMGGYLTNHGQVELSRAEIILEGLAKREDDIFRRRREAEERQDHNAKRRKVEKEMSAKGRGPSASLNLTSAPVAPPLPSGPVHHPLPPKPTNSDSIGMGGPKSAETAMHAPTAAQALAGSNRDVVANRRAIRMANMSAAEMLRAQMAGLQPLKLSKSTKSMTTIPPTKSVTSAHSTSVSVSVAAPAPVPTQPDLKTDNEEVPGLGMSVDPQLILDPTTIASSETVVQSDEMDADESATEESMTHLDGSPRGVKRPIDEVEADDEPEVGSEDDDDEAPVSTSLTLKVNPDGTVEQEDLVKLWEPGYRERYYRQKFGVERSDAQFRKEITTRYMEGLAWVLQYYYQGTPSWQWYYPYHFAPFAADFEDVRHMNIKFKLGQPFKPFEQLMGVLPAASRKHIPEVFQSLMTEETSSIIDFYPSTFEVDMNGKRMLWQGVALLPFIDEQRLLDAMAERYPQISEDEKRRNQWGNTLLYVYEEHPLYPSLEALYGKRDGNEPMSINVKVNKGISGSLLPNPDCIPGSHYYCPLSTVNLKDIKGDRSLSAAYLFPKQLSPHRSVLLPGVQRPRPVLTEEDREVVKRGGRGRGRGRGGYDNSTSRGYSRGGSSHGPSSHSSGQDRDFGGRNGHQDGTSYRQSSYHGGYPNEPQHTLNQSYPNPPYNSRGSANSYRPIRGRGAPRGRGGYDSGNSFGGYGSTNSRGYRAGGRGGYGGEDGYGSYGGRGGGRGGNDANGGGYGSYGGYDGGYGRGGAGGVANYGGYGGAGGYSTNGGYAGNSSRGGPQHNGYGSYGGGGGGHNTRGGYNSRGRGRGY